MSLKHKVMKVGNSLGVTVPMIFVKRSGIKPGDEVLVEVKMERNQVVYKFSGIQQLTIADNLK